jgi:hypothetical protein
LSHEYRCDVRAIYESTTHLVPWRDDAVVAGKTPTSLRSAEPRYPRGSLHPPGTSLLIGVAITNEEFAD